MLFQENHPYIAFRLAGLQKIILGSTGTGGKEAADQLVIKLREGHSTVITPEGPHGPLGKPKKGILHISLQSCAPIYLLTFDASREFRLPGWDRKRIPLPFGVIQMKLERKIQVTEENFEESKTLLDRAFAKL